jgi:C-terminal processing protease CtpA/Prc
MKSEEVEDAEYVPVPAAAEMARAASSAVSCGIGLSLRRNCFGQYFLRRFSGASHACGVFNVGDQLVALDGRSVDGVSARTVRKWTRGSAGSALHVTVKCCDNNAGSRYDYSLAGKDICVDQTFTTFVVRSPARVTPPLAYIGAGLVLKRVAGAHGQSVTCYTMMVREGAPAAAAGVVPGDVLTAVDGIRVENRSSSAVVRLLQGPANSQVELSFQRNSAAPDIANEYTIRLHRVHLSSPDMCLDFSENTRSLPAQTAPPPAAARTRAPSSSQQGVGFGMNLKRDSNGAFYVRRLDVGGPSAACGRIVVGDECLAIDGVALRGKSYSALSRLVLGAPSSAVELQMQSPRGGAIQRIMLHRRSHAPSIPEEDGDAGRSSSRGTPDAAAATPVQDERVGIGATFRKGRNGVFEARAVLLSCVGSSKMLISRFQKVEQLDLGGPAEVSGGEMLCAFICNVHVFIYRIGQACM